MVKSIGGSNAIFINEELLKKTSLKSYLPKEIYQECYLRNKWSNSTAIEQYETIKHLKFENV